MTVTDCFSPHPRAKECTIAAAKVVLDAAVKAGAPAGIIGWIDVPSRFHMFVSVVDVLSGIVVFDDLVLYHAHAGLKSPSLWG